MDVRDVVRQDGQKVSESIGKLEGDDIDAVCTLDPSLNDVGEMDPGGDDFGNAPGATGQISVGSSAIGNLETDGDVDWFAVTLDGGTAYTVDVEGRRTGGGSLGDPLVRIYDTTGAEVAMDDDSGEGLNPRATFTTGAGGTYYIGVEAFGSGTGDYTVRISR